MIKVIEFRMLVLANSNIVKFDCTIFEWFYCDQSQSFVSEDDTVNQDFFGTQTIVFDCASVFKKIKNSSCFAPLYPFPPEIG